MRRPFLLALLVFLMPARHSGSQPFEIPHPNLPSDVAGLNPSIAVIFGTLKWADYNGDGNFDFLLLGRLPATSSGAVPLYGDVFRSSPAILGEPPTRVFSFFIVRSIERLWLSNADWGDFDRDGDLDLITIGAASIQDPLDPRTVLYETVGNTITAIETGIPGLHSGAVRWGDFDNDGDPDLAMLGIDGGGSHVMFIYRNEGQGRFTVVPAPIPGLAYGSLEWLDFDVDGDLDLFVSGAAEDGALYSRLYRNEGGFFVDSGEQFEPLAFSRIAVGDFDSDSDPDILLSGQRRSAAYGTGRTLLYRNDSGRFPRIPTDIPGTYYGDVKWADYDRDGDLDVLISGRTKTFGSSLMQACVQGGAAEFACRQLQLAGLGGQPVPGLAYGSIALADYDGDSDLDVMVSGMRTNTEHFTTLYKSLSAVANVPPLPPEGLSSVTGPGTVTLSWNPSSDRETPATGLTYELRVGTAPGGLNIVAPRADPQTGFRRVVEAGGVGSGTSWFLQNLRPGTYYWSVQAVDNSYAGSPFAAEASFTIGG